MESVFAANPNVELIYVFEDGNAFLTKNMADGHKNITKQDYKIVEKTKEVKPTKTK